MSKYTPTTDEVRSGYMPLIQNGNNSFEILENPEADFDRWLKRHEWRTRGIFATWFLAAVAVVVLLVVVWSLTFTAACEQAGGFTIWGYTWRYGFEHYELQCVLGRFE